MSPLALALAVELALYGAAVLVLGLASRARSARSPEEFFLAGRTLGTFVLFMALFGTNCTAFVLVGVPGLAYHEGVGVFGINAPIVALGIPLSFWAIGSPARRMARRLGALTPAELYARRFESRAVGWVLFGFFGLYTLPYMVTAVDGAAKCLHAVFDAMLPEWVTALSVLGLALAYTALGGMRATAWTNVLQGGLFMTFTLAAFVLVARSMGGLAEAARHVREHDPDLLLLGSRGLQAPRSFASWGLAISLTVIAFPHMLVRLMAGRDEATLRRISLLYPVALVLLWLPVVLLGVWGAAEFPGLLGRDSDRVFALMVSRHLPPWIAAAGFLAVLAAVMSTLDAQLLTLGSMLVRDVLRPISGSRESARQVRLGRVFGLVLGGLVFLLWLPRSQSIYSLASVAFSGYVTLVPTLLLGVRWRRFGTRAAIASILAGNGVYAAALVRGGGLDAALAPSWLGFLPVLWAFLAALAVGLLVGSLAAPPPPEVLARAFGSAVAPARDRDSGWDGPATRGTIPGSS